jgi:sirohydrochlorin cobaltochelatase
MLAHGSRDAAARREYREVASGVAERLPGVGVEFAVLEFPGEDLQSIAEGVRRCAEGGAERIVALPFFLFSAGHVREDLPGELADAARRYPSLRLAYQPPLGVDSSLIDVLEARAAEADVELADRAESSAAVLLVGAGTSDADANAELFRAGRLLWERRRFDLVEVAFVSLTKPGVSDGIGRCLALGARRVLVVPYFLTTGVLSRRIAARLETERREHPEACFALAREMGLHPNLLDTVAKLAREALEAGGRDGLDLPPCTSGERAWSCWRV